MFPEPSWESDDEDSEEVVEIGEDEDDEEDDLFFMKAAQDVIDAPYFTFDDARAEGMDDDEERVGGLSQAEWEVAMRQYGKSSVELFTSDEALELAYTLSDMKAAAELFIRWRSGEVVIESFDREDGVEFKGFAP